MPCHRVEERPKPLTCLHKRPSWGYFCFRRVCMEKKGNIYVNESLLRLTRAEKKFKMLFELSPIGMAMINHETGAFLEVNQSLLNSTG
ncbi:hypothetical protein ADUPG1_004459, partial [Aduncisulcus paluster]